MLSNFGSSRYVGDGATMPVTNPFKRSINWMAVELVIPIDDEGSVDLNQLHTMKSDVWSLGMVFYASNFIDSSRLTTE